MSVRGTTHGRPRRHTALRYLSGELRPNDQDPTVWAAKYDAIGGVPGKPLNNFQEAVLFYGSSIDLRALREVADRARGNESSASAVEWARRLRLAQIRHTGTGWDLKNPADAVVR